MSRAAITIPEHLKAEYETAKEYRLKMVWGRKNPELLTKETQEFLSSSDHIKIEGAIRYFVQDSYYKENAAGEKVFVPADIRDFSFEYEVPKKIWRFTCSTGD